MLLFTYSTCINKSADCHVLPFTNTLAEFRLIPIKLAEYTIIMVGNNNNSNFC